MAHQTYSYLLVLNRKEKLLNLETSFGCLFQPVSFVIAGQPLRGWMWVVNHEFVSSALGSVSLS